MDGLRENPIRIDDLGVSPIFGNTHILYLASLRTPVMTLHLATCQGQLPLQLVLLPILVANEALGTFIFIVVIPVDG